MHLLACLSLIMAVAQGPVQAPTKAADPWAGFRFLLGEWAGEGQGQPGNTTGTATFRLDLDGRIMVRTSRTAVPATGQQPAYTHEDLFVVYRASAGQMMKAIYFDNEDHTIEYTASVSADGNAVTFVSAVTPGAPRFRLVYTRLAADQVRVSFEMAPPGSPEAFKPYTSGVTRKVK